MYLMKDPPYENLIHFDQTWQLKLWNDEKKKTAAQSKQNKFHFESLFQWNTNIQCDGNLSFMDFEFHFKKRNRQKTTGNCFSPLSYIKINKH